MSALIVDSHCHLDRGPLNKELDAVIARAGQAGVGLMVTIGTQLETFPRTLAVAQAHANVYATVGTHPHHAEAERDQVSCERLLELAAHPKVAGIGEAGLDYFYDRSERAVQREVFRRHIAAARKSGLPLVIHTRAAEEDTAEILREEMQKGAFSFVMHCFSSAPWLAELAVELGGYVSFSGILTFKKSDEVRAAAAAVPLERLLVETDSPFLAPVPHRGKPCEPAYTALTLQKLADIKGLERDEMARITTDNFLRLFARVPDPRKAA